MAFEFNHTLETMDGVPDIFKGLYVPGEGGNGFVFHPDFKTHTSGLTTALDKERKNVRELKLKVDGWVKLGATPDEVQTKLTELTEAATKGGEGKANYDKLKKDLEDGHKRDLAAKDGTVTAMRTSLEKHLIDAEAATAISEAKGVPVLLLPHVRASVRVIEENGSYIVRIVDKDGEARGNSKGGFMTIRDLVAEMKGSDTFSRAFEATGATGGGKPPVGKGTGVGNGQGKTELSSIEKIRTGLAAGQAARKY